MPPHNMAFTLIGATMLWVGWFGFNAGSAVAANASAGMAMAVTQISAAIGALSWLLCETSPDILLLHWVWHPGRLQA